MCVSLSQMKIKDLFVRKHIKLFVVDKQPGLIRRRNVFYPTRVLIEQFLKREKKFNSSC